MKANHKRLHTVFLMNPKDDEKIKETAFRYLERLDPIHLKYAVESDRITDGEKTYKSPLPTSVRREATLYESTFRYGELNKETYSSIRENLMLVYGSEYVVKKDIRLFHLTEKKIIRDYLAIPQLEKMFDEDYFNFEWDMHVGVNFTEHRNDYQRDHFIHEIRDMYSMLILLDNYSFFDTSFDILRNRTVSKISRFAYQKLNNFLMNKSGNYSLLERIRPDLMKALTEDDTVSDEAKKRCSSIEEYATTYFFKYVIYASSMMSALFHDMGYPICHFLNVRNRISEYNPTMYMFTHNAVESFDHIASLLSSSLLFTIVSPNEIKESMQCHDGKYNHGAYSAIAFLMQFYNSGIIFSLPEEKQCAIEIAAVAIYDHTVTYKILDDESTDNFYQPVFEQNPIAFLLRLCDDLQEWGRRYFEFSHQSDIPFCSKCYTPSVFHHNYKESKVEYSCLCTANSKKKVTYNSFRNYQFYNRKLYLVSTSEYMFSDIILIQGTDNDNTLRKALRFKINYDYYKLLNITRINPTYAKYRISELNLLKRLLKNQIFSDFSKMNFDYIYLDYFMTANPLTIKIKILQKYLAVMLKKDPEIEDVQFLSAQEILKRLKIDCTNKLSKILLNGTYDFYVNLLIKAMTVHKEVDQLIKTNEFSWEKFYILIETTTQNVISISRINFAKSDYYQKIMQILVFETLEQYSKETYATKIDGKIQINGFISSELYYHQYAPIKIEKEYDTKKAELKVRHAKKNDDSIFYKCVAAYCNAENDFNNYKHYNNYYKNQYINYFADLHFFEKMNQVVQENALKEFLT